MAALSPAKREAVKAILRVIMKVSLSATRVIDPQIIGEDKPRRMNLICAEFLYFHMWRACKRAQTKMMPDAYREFSEYTVKGMAVLASGCFTGSFDKKAETDFVLGLKNAFGNYARCNPDMMSVKDPMTSNFPMSTLARRIADLAGKPKDEPLITGVMVIIMESFNATRVNDGVDAVVRAM